MELLLLLLRRPMTAAPHPMAAACYSSTVVSPWLHSRHMMTMLHVPSDGTSRCVDVSYLFMTRTSLYCTFSNTDVSLHLYYLRTAFGNIVLYREKPAAAWPTHGTADAAHSRTKRRGRKQEEQNTCASRQCLDVLGVFNTLILETPSTSRH